MMNRNRNRHVWAGLMALFGVIFLLTPGMATAQHLNLNNTPVEIYFSPNGGCEDAVVRSIAAAQSQILVQAYYLTSAPIAKALRDAHRRGVPVEVILDKSQMSTQYSSATFLDNAGIPTYIDTVHAIAHNKIIIIDRATVITGSYNFTKAAQEKNAENLLIIRSRELARTYQENWYAHKAHAIAYKRGLASVPSRRARS